jgi:NAD(P)-dependent dehydrogenase (short-subunit alcohol dehydrogenase family)
MGTMTADFTGEVALVTGAAGGMGRAIAIAFAGAGAAVVMGDVDEDGGRMTERLVGEAGGRGRFERVDVADAGSVEMLVRTAVEMFGGLRCAVNAAAIETETVALHECSDESFDRIHQPAYTASKHAVLGLTRSAAFDYAALGIRVNAICPGAIDTPMLRQAIERRGRDPHDVVSRLSLLGRFGRPDEIAAAALWLCSDAASFTTGSALAVDAGYLSR